MKTGGGGRQLYFAHPGDILRSRVGIVPGIDIRGDGGCIVAPPSMHPSGKRYKWVKDRGPSQTTLASLPNWIEQTIRTHDKQTGRSTDRWRDLLHDGISEGERNDTIASITGNLLWHGVGAEVAMELMLCWNRVRCHPPLDDEEVARTVHSICRIHERH